MGMQMKDKQLACPTCGHTYPALFLRSRSTCPACHSKIQTDLKAVGIVETIIGAPLLWLFAAVLRTLLQDEVGMLSYALLFPVALAIHFLVVRRFVGAHVINTTPPTDD